MQLVHGVITAIVTPMMEDGAIDIETFRELVSWQIELGVRGIVVAGTTGEVSTLCHGEHIALVGEAVQIARGRACIIAGAGSNSTNEAIELTRHARDVGADAALQVVPYYNKPTQDGLYNHFRAIAEAVDIDLVLYNVPSRVGTKLHPYTTARLSHVPGIVGVKDTEPSMLSMYRLLRMHGVRHGFKVYSGDDITSPGAVRLGANGVVSVASNLAPALCLRWHENGSAWGPSDDALLPDSLLRRMFAQANPMPIKHALHEAGLVRSGIRQPLTWLACTPGIELCAIARRSACSVGDCDESPSLLLPGLDV
ncbi:4-hydroxy-tetrahydrodipicolinate synthase [Candidatus Tremblaya princeps]|uniref:4-hydroxy-tetrahydrodipicolinate synthase n=1 Tax=Tremblaya princeps TaxID=189385 RepID=A0A143WN03_TREPR|nr:4-hydroxy-tetrahydrodipicolinate synthase [Candidatus Tremblaya princeps]